MYTCRPYVFGCDYDRKRKEQISLKRLCSCCLCSTVTTMDANWHRCCLLCQLLFRSEERRQSRHQRQLIKPSGTIRRDGATRFIIHGGGCVGQKGTVCVSGDHRMVDVHFRSNQRWRTGPKWEIRIFVSQFIRIFYVFSWFRAMTDIATSRLLRIMGCRSLDRSRHGHIWWLCTCCCSYSFLRILYLHSWMNIKPTQL